MIGANVPRHLLPSTTACRAARVQRLPLVGQNESRAEQISMQVTGLGHASALIETKYGSILTDPWVHPAYFGSWFPFPDNSQLDWDRIGQADYLFVSHLHRDHFDPEHLKRYVSKKATVLLPAYATSELEDQLRELGFRSFVRTVSD